MGAGEETAAAVDKEGAEVMEAAAKIVRITPQAAQAAQAGAAEMAGAEEKAETGPL